MDRRAHPRLLWPTLFTLAGVAILIGLGKWQLDRKVWKEELIARLEAGAKAEPVTLSDALAADDLADAEFRRVRIRGRFRHDRELHVWSPSPQGAGWSVTTPFELSDPLEFDRKPVRFAFVIRGVVPDAKKDPTSRTAGQAAGEVDLVGRIRLDRPSPFASPPEPGKNVWLARDINVMAERVERTDAAPVFVEAEAGTGGDDAPIPRLDALTLTNRHLEYALTWFGLAATLIAVYGAFVRSRMGPRGGEKPFGSDT